MRVLHSILVQESVESRIEGCNFNPGPDPRSKIYDSARRLLGKSWILDPGQD